MENNNMTTNNQPTVLKTVISSKGSFQVDIISIGLSTWWSGTKPVYRAFIYGCDENGKREDGWFCSYYSNGREDLETFAEYLLSEVNR